MEALMWVLGVALGVYLAVAFGWWRLNTDEARRMLGIARDRQERLDANIAVYDEKYEWASNLRAQRDEKLQESREAAEDARWAPIWPAWVVRNAARHLTEERAVMTEIRTGTTDLDPIQRSDRLAELEAETEKLRKEQEKESN